MYDFIIVGSGCAGTVLANRLSEEPNWKILLLEAGNPELPIMDIPVLAPAFQDTEYDWSYRMERENGLFNGLEESRMGYPRGKALGGSSTINYMIYTRGNRYDYDRWSKQGNPGWSYDEILPYFLKSERANLQDADFNFHGHSGVWNVEKPYHTPLVDVFVNASQELGLKHTDYNTAENLFVVDSVQGNLLNGRRQSTAKAFLWPIKNRKNLHIITNAFVTKLLIHPDTKQTYGVIYEKDDQQFIVKTSKEIILSAGSFNTPKLLMLSGIGPEQHLNELNIKVVKNLSVGRNLQDHLTYTGLAFTINKPISLSLISSLNLQPVFDYLSNGNGPLASLGGAEGVAYIKTSLADYEELYPDVELLFIGGSLTSDVGLLTRRAMRIKDNIFYNLFNNILTTPNWSIFPMVLHPKSVGFIKLRSTNPYDAPILHGNYFSDKNNNDIKTFIAAIRFIERLAETGPFQMLNSTLNPSKTPGCEQFRFDSDEYWECSLKSFSVTLHHQVGTVKMGPSNDPEAVVDSNLKVYGVGGLRVADCSVIPFALSAHTSAPSVMIGEKGADIIKSFWKNEEKHV